jgi:hypothetical protein
LLDWRSGWWLLPWLAGMGVISYLGQFDGRSLIPFWWDLAVVAVFSLGIYVLALRIRLPDELAQRYIQEASEGGGSTGSNPTMA